MKKGRKEYFNGSLKEAKDSNSSWAVAYVKIASNAYMCFASKMDAYLYKGRR
jgi:hypothetical protein